MENHPATLSSSIYYDLQQIARLQDYGSAKQLRTAFEIARHNSDVGFIDLVPLDAATGIKTTYGRSRYT